MRHFNFNFDHSYGDRAVPFKPKKPAKAVPKADKKTFGPRDPKGPTGKKNFKPSKMQRSPRGC